MTAPDVAALHAAAATSIRSEVDERSLDMSERLLKVDEAESPRGTRTARLVVHPRRSAINVHPPLAAVRVPAGASPARTPRMYANDCFMPGSGSSASISYSRFT